MKSSALFATLAVTLNLSSFAQAQNSSSAEFQCRNKAKEIAAETYKGCMTDNRQAQLEQIRKEYKEKLSDLKSHYDKELKKMAGQNSANSLGSPVPNSEGDELSNTAATSYTTNSTGQPAKDPVETKTTYKQPKASKVNSPKRSLGQRASGARNMPSSLPAKKTPVKSQVIDLSTPSGTQDTESIEATQSENRLKIEQDGANDIEVVELPYQE